MFFDTHTHTFFSGDGQQSMEDAVIAAKNKSLSGIVFTDHVDFNYPDVEPDYFLVDYQKYNNEFLRIKSLYEDESFKVLKGIEGGIVKTDIDLLRKSLSENSFDQIIGSVHIINGFDPYFGKYYGNESKQTKYKEYLNVMIDALPCYEFCDIFGHFDYLVRYAPYDDSQLKYNDFPEELDFILKYIVDNNKCLEINTRSYLKVPLDVNVLKRYRELGGEMISLGSDAHKSSDIAINFFEYADIIKDAGFNYLTHFEARKPVFEKI